MKKHLQNFNKFKSSGQCAVLKDTSYVWSLKKPLLWIFFYILVHELSKNIDPLSKNAT